jgi:hypothetical protein
MISGLVKVKKISLLLRMFKFLFTIYRPGRWHGYMKETKRLVIKQVSEASTVAQVFLLREMF